MRTFAEVGSALLAIRDGKLYRDGSGRTFEDYCKERWGLKERRAYQLMDAAKATKQLQSCTIVQLPATESQARPLAALPADEQPAAWTAATERAKAEKRPVTARDVQAEVGKRRKDAGVLTGRPTFKTPEDEEKWYAKQARKEVDTSITDPLSGKVDAPDIDADEDRNAESQNLAGLKRYWNYSSKKDRKAFLNWIGKEGSR